MRDRWRQRFRPVIQPLQLHTLLKGEVGCGKKRLDKVGAFGQQTSNNMNVHLMTVPTNCIIAIYISMTINEVIHIAAVPFAIHNHILEIKFSRFEE